MKGVHAVPRIGISTSSFGIPDNSPLLMLKRSGIDIRMNPYGRRLNRSEAIEFVQDLDGLIAGLEPLDREVLESATHLKVIARVGIGMDNIDHEAAAELGIKVSNTPDPPSFAVAEMTVAALLSLVRDICGFSTSMKSGLWEKRVTASLKDMTVHLIGFGRIGRKVAEMLTPFEVNFLITDPLISEADISGIGRLVSLEEGLREADVISLHASGKEIILGPKEMSIVKTGAILLNSARGDLVDETALLDAIESGSIGAAWFDTFWEEPHQGALLEVPDILLTPHVSTYTSTCRCAMETEAVENLLRDLEFESA
jgi:D-3-phosphoglycerate dehydrogenase